MSRKKSGIVNVRMVITEEKILSNIDKVQKMINPNSKKQIVQLEDDIYFKDLIESIKAYLIEYPKKKNFPVNVYKASYGLVEYATIQFEENTKKVEELIRQREENIALAGKLRELVETVETKNPDWKEKVEEAEEEAQFAEEVIETLKVIGKARSKKTESYQSALKLLNAKISNLETNLHIEIDMERTEDRSKALSFIGIEVAEALKTIPKPIEIGETVIEETSTEENLKINEEKIEEPSKEQEDLKVTKIEENVEEQEVIDYQESVLFEEKPSLWQKIKNSKLARAVSYVFKIRVRIKIELPNALPEGRGE